MTQIAIDAQVNAIKKATQKALKTKESALKFLADAGIITEKKQEEVKQSNTENKKK